MASVRIGSFNTACDNNAVKMTERDGTMYSFYKRFTTFRDMILSKHIEVILIEELRFDENVKALKELLEPSFNVKIFQNIDVPHVDSFHNVIALRKDSPWEIIKTNQYWNTLNKDNTPAVSEDPEARVPEIKELDIKGDIYGRSVGVCTVRHKTNGTCFAVAVQHPVSRGKTKAIQREGSVIDLTKKLQSKYDLHFPIIFGGDFNIFHEERVEPNGPFHDFVVKADKLGLVEVPLVELNLPDGVVIRDTKEIGTFTPWTCDDYYDVVIRQPLGHSKLDTFFVSKDIQCTNGGITVTPIPIEGRPLNDPNNAEPGWDKIRFMLGDALCSDHFLLEANFVIPSNKYKL